YPAQGYRFPIALLIHTLFGTLLVASGTGALNQFVEWRFDAQMRRTAWRPIPAGRLAPPAALRFGIFLSLTGSIYLAAAVNVLAAFLAILTSISYLFLYTPLKRRTPLCTLAGAFPGAMPPLIGWAAASGSLSPEAWTLYTLLFLWQLPHFMAIAWMYREDYARAGCPMLPVLDPQGGSTARMILLYSVVLIPVTLLPARLGVSSVSYFSCALVLGVAFLACGVCAAFFRTPVYAKRLLLASVLYLPALLTWMMVTRTT